MNLVHSRRALADLEEIATYYSTRASPVIARSIEIRFVDVIERIRRALNLPRGSVNVHRCVWRPLFVIHSESSIASVATASISCTSATHPGGRLISDKLDWVE